MWENKYIQNSQSKCMTKATGENDTVQILAQYSVLYGLLEVQLLLRMSLFK